MFEAFDSGDKVSIHELERVIKRKPLMVRKETANQLARYIVESRTGPATIEYNELAEETLTMVLERLTALVPDYPVFGSEKEKAIRVSLAKQVSGKTGRFKDLLRTESNSANVITCEDVRRLNKENGMGLTSEEEDYLALMMYRVSNDAKRLPAKIMYKELQDALSAVAPAADSAVGNAKEDAGAEAEEGESPTSTVLRETTEPPQESAKPVGPNSKVDNKDREDVDEEKMIEIAQKCFMQIADQINKKGLTLAVLYEGKVFEQEIDGEEVSLLTPEDFVDGLRRVGVEGLQTIEYACLIKVLAVNDEEKYIRFSDLEQILQDYGVDADVGETAQGAGNKRRLNFEGLDNISMIIMLALTEYLIKEKISLYEMFGPKIYKQVVQTKTTKRTVELISSKDFFEMLQQVGVKIEEGEHENLKDFLCIDAGYRDKFAVNKLKKTVEEFAFNDELRARAQKYYQELSDNLADASANGGGEGAADGGVPAGEAAQSDGDGRGEPEPGVEAEAENNNGTEDAMADAEAQLVSSLSR